MTHLISFLRAHPWAVCFVLVLTVALVFQPDITYAAGDLDTKVIQGNSDAATNFNNMMSDSVHGIRYVANIIATIMIALGGLMVAMNVDGPNKLLWNSVLGIGLAVGFAGFLTSVFDTSEAVKAVGDSFGQAYHLPVATGDNAPDFKAIFSGDGSFFDTYRKATEYGALHMIAPAAKILLILTTIEASIKISLDLITGDKIKYLTEVTLHTGVYLFLILNWYGSGGLNIMGSLCQGFEQLGIEASGINLSVASDGANGVQAADIFGSAYKIVLYGLKEGTSLAHPIMSIPCVIMVLFMGFLLILAGIEMLMARIEFWTLAMLTIPLIPFAALSATRFLFQSALNAMLNLSIKVCVIAFIGCLSSEILLDYVKAFQSDHDIGTDISLLLQGVLISLLLYIITKQIPQLVSGLISGRPELGGASMVALAKGAGSAGVKAGAAVASGGATVAKGAAGAAAKAAGSGYKAAGGGIAGLANGAVQGMGAGLNTGAGMMMSGAKGMASRALIGEKGGVDNKYSGGLLSGVYNAAQAGKGIAKSFDNRPPMYDAKSGLEIGKGQYQSATDHAKAAGNSVKQGATNAIEKVGHGVKAAKKAVKTVATDIKRDLQDSQK